MGPQWKQRTSCRYVITSTYSNRRVYPNRKGVINYPRQRKTTEVELTPEKEKEVEDAIAKVNEISALPIPPHADYMKICKSCSYQELCWS